MKSCQSILEFLCHHGHHLDVGKARVLVTMKRCIRYTATLKEFLPNSKASFNEMCIARDNGKSIERIIAIKQSNPHMYEGINESQWINLNH